jgi:hemolysin III
MLQLVVYDVESVNKMIELPMNPSREILASANRCPGQISWDYDRAEIIADGVVHAIGVALGAIGAITIAVIAVRIEHSGGVPILVYVIGLVTMLALSAAYNMWPVSPAKWLLRRFDHSAIYLLIAGTYTPFLAQMKSALVSTGLGVGVWVSAVIGMALKLALPGRFDRLAVVLCLLLGWSGVLAYDSLASAVPSASLWLLAIGGILYSVGALFHVWRGLRFHNAIWHGLVLMAASCHYSAVMLALDIGGS